MAANPRAAGRRARVLRLARRVGVAAALVALGVALARSRDDVVAVVRSAQPLLLLGALVLSLAQLVLTSALWSAGLRALGSPLPGRTVLRATVSSVAARYLPGSVWYAVSRGAVLHRAGAPLGALGVVATLETLLVPLVGVVLGIVLLAAGGGSAGRAPLPVPVLVIGSLLGLVAVPLVVAAVLRVLRRRRPDLPRLGAATVGRLVVWVAVFWVSSAATFVLFVAAFPAEPLGASGPFEVAGAYVLAWAVGWVAIFAPQGVGVFEVTLAVLLAAPDLSAAAVVLAGFRVVVLVRDLAVTAGVALVRRRRGRSSTGPASPAVVGD